MSWECREQTPPWHSEPTCSPQATGPGSGPQQWAELPDKSRAGGEYFNWLNKGPQNVPILNPEPVDVSLRWQRDFVDVIKDPWRGDDPGYPGGPDVIARVCGRQWVQGQTGRLKDAALWALKRGKGP